MNLVFDRIWSADHPCFAILIALYEQAFPVVERRDLPALIEKLSDQRMYFSAVLLDASIVGLIVYWQFEGFLYVEHLALFPEQHRKGIGSEVLKMVQKMGCPVLLEVEIPYDAISSNRVKFYNKSGFQALNIPYFQPPYRVGESLLPMTLFSDQVNWEMEELLNSIQIFQMEVYQYQSVSHT